MCIIIGLDRFQHVPKVLEDLKNEAKKRGFWNLFLTHHTLPPHLADLEPSIKLTLREYGIMCELLGRRSWLQRLVIVLRLIQATWR